MKKLFVLISVLFLIGSVTFAQNQKTNNPEKKAKTEAIDKNVKPSNKDLKSSEKALKAGEKELKKDEKNAKSPEKELKSPDKRGKQELKDNEVKAENNEASENQGGPEISFKETSHDFGNIPFKGNGSYDFVFVNTGNEPLILTQPKSSCGCTVPEWPRKPILPGESDVVKVTYKNTDRPGNFNKYVTVFSNSVVNKEIKLHIKGTVLPQPTDAAPLNDGTIETPVKNN